MEMGVDMKINSLFKSVENSTIKLSKNQLFSVKGKNIQIHCLYGDLWITWPERGERILKSGQTFRVSSRGKICIVALSNTLFQMRRRKWYRKLKVHQKLSSKNIDTDMFPFPTQIHGFVNRTEKAWKTYIKS
jgi:hypothetical protein